MEKWVLLALLGAMAWAVAEDSRVPWWPFPVEERYEEPPTLVFQRVRTNAEDDPLYRAVRAGLPVGIANEHEVALAVALKVSGLVVQPLLKQAAELRAANKREYERGVRETVERIYAEAAFETSERRRPKANGSWF